MSQATLNKSSLIAPSLSQSQTANGLTGGLKPTFIEGFAKIYSYPYGNSFLPRDSAIN